MAQTRKISLPYYLWAKIYLYYFRGNVLPFIHRYRCYKTPRSFVIAECDSETCYLTNSLEKPTYITTSYLHQKTYLAYFPDRRYHHVEEKEIDALHRYFSDPE